MDIEGKKVNSNLFSGPEWIITIGNNMYSLSFSELSPRLIFGGYNDHAVIGKSDCYKLKVIDKSGRIIKDIERNVKRNPLETKELQYFIKEINNIKGMNDQVKKAFQNLIPTEKMYFEKLMITSRYIFVLKTKKDSTDENSPYPVDIFEINEKFIGEVTLPHVPSRPSRSSQRSERQVFGPKEENRHTRANLFALCGQIERRAEALPGLPAICVDCIFRTIGSPVS
ncbi:MAG: hypothetical protein ACM3SY_06765 [Candidatus Omnitrophota bacterium]